MKTVVYPRADPNQKTSKGKSPIHLSMVGAVHHAQMDGTFALTEKMGWGFAPESREQEIALY